MRVFSVTLSRVSRPRQHTCRVTANESVFALPVPKGEPRGGRPAGSRLRNRLSGLNNSLCSGEEAVVSEGGLPTSAGSERFGRGRLAETISEWRIFRREGNSHSRGTGLLAGPSS